VKREKPEAAQQAAVNVSDCNSFVKPARLILAPPFQAEPSAMMLRVFLSGMIQETFFFSDDHSCRTHMVEFFYSKEERTDTGSL
jgi:hypothetical protein